MRVGGTTIVVTGAGSGMGRALVLELLARGATVAGVDRNAQPLAETAAAAAAGDRLSLHVLDVTDAAAVAALPEAVVAAHSQVDGLINNAGIIQPFVDVADLPEDTARRVLEVNFWGPLRMVQAFLPALRERPQAHIANVSSMGAFLPVPGQGVYGASKAAVKLLTEALYAELLETRIGVSVIMPGAVETGITENSGVSMPAAAGAPADPGAGAQARVTRPDVAARIMLDGIEADRLHILVGRDARLMNLAVRLSPRRATHLIHRQMKKMLAAT